MIAMPGAADAASRFCRQLEARLEEPPGSAQFRKYERAAEEQLQEIIEVERQAGGRGCFDAFYNDPLCPGLLGTLDRMDRNLAAIERRRDLLARRNDTSRERARIMAALEANRCNEDEQEEVRILPPPIASDDQTQESRNVISGPFQSGTFRTLCVRTCDGYYFPISYSVTPDLFVRDERKCQAMCPGTDVRLYSHRVPGEESKDMVSGAGTPYSELPTAFRYREAGYVRPEGCGCSSARNFSVIAGEPPEADGLEAGSQPLVPTPRPAPATVGGKPEEKTAAAPQPAGAEPAGDGKIRVVGPKFLPDPEGAIDLRSPGRSEVR